jgi:hypothetical protein
MIPSGAVLDAPADVRSTGTVRVSYEGQPLMVLGLDFLDSAQARESRWLAG